MAIRGSPDDPLAGFVLSAPHRSQLLAIDSSVRCDLTGFAIGGMQEHEPQVAVLAMQGDQPRSTHHVIVGVRYGEEHHLSS